MNDALLQIDPTKKQINFKSFTITYNNLESAEQTITEIFNDLPYQFTAINNPPFIIDAGSNIGIATLFFKENYPNAKILCFEPDPNAFQLLKTNITHNKITNTHLINAALSKEEGEINFFGQIFVDSPDARGNSILDSWGSQRTISNTTQVTSVKLSSYINSTVDFLKLDIEGAEQHVLEDLEQENKLAFIRAIAIEVHHSDKIKEMNDVNRITQLLSRNQFNLDVIEKNMDDVLPDQIKHWIKKIHPRFFAIRATKL